MQISRQSSDRSHPCNACCTYKTTIVMQIRLYDLCPAILYHPPEASQTSFLFSPGDWDCKDIGSLFCIFQMVKWAGLLKKHRVDILKHSANLNSFWRVIGTVGIGMYCNIIAKYFPGKRNKFFSPAGHSIGIVAHPPADSEFHCLYSGLFYSLLQEFNFILWNSIPTTAGKVNGNLSPYYFSDKFPNWFSRNFSQKVEQAELHPGDTAPQCKPRKFVVTIISIYIK